MHDILTSTATTEKLGQLDVIKINNTYATARISMFGGHVLSFAPKHDNIERLWLSDKAVLDGSKAIRGGIPVCWPWFSDSHGKPELSLPSHGYLRDQVWTLISCRQLPMSTELVLSPSSTAGKGFEGQADVLLTVTVGKQLEVRLTTKNSGTQAFSISTALHSYFAVENIYQTALLGLSGKYKDKTQNWQVLDTPSPYTICQETDRIHLCQADTVTIKENTRETKVLSKGHDSLVVWNPWSALSQSMGDMPDQGYQSMLCVETAVTEGTRLQPGQQHELVQVIS